MKDQYCPNCHHPIESHDQFCSHCGQKNIEGKIKLSELVKEFFSNVLNWDSKLYKTPMLLLRPGFLTKEFFKGKRKRYTSPGRLLLFTLLVYFALFAFHTKGDFEELDEDNNMRKIGIVNDYFDDNRDSLERYLTERHPDVNSADLVETVDEFIALDSTTFHINYFNGARISGNDIMSLSDEELLDKYKIEGYFERLLVRRTKKIIKSPGGYVAYVFSLLSWVILGSIPFLGITLALMYIRQNRYYVEHIIFLTHINAFIFLLGVLMFLLGNIFEYDVLQYGLLVPGLIGPIYIFFAMKNFYGQGFFKTFVKYIGLLWSAFFTFMSLGLFIFGIGMFLF